MRMRSRDFAMHSATESAHYRACRKRALPRGYPPVIGWKQMLTVPRSGRSRESEVPTTQFAGVDRHYLRTLGIEMERGRDFSDNDTATSQPVAVVNEEFAR